ncbi:MAG: tRNA-dihydrouridine synthase family protein [Deltaproteobacteria bacterium]|nr:tRNA-dihydrouridine synthase family protein [Deltaproteobacteria bacterium]
MPWLAPLAGHTDLALRVLCREQGAAVACSEMISAKGLIYSQIRGRRKGLGREQGEAQPTQQGTQQPQPGRNLDNGSAALLLTLPGSNSFAQTLSPALTLENFPAPNTADEPLVIQLFGDDPDILGQAVELLRGWGYDWFDLNLGCSVPKVVKTGAGAALARDTDKTLRAAEAMIRAAGALPSANINGVSKNEPAVPEYLNDAPGNIFGTPEKVSGAVLPARGRVGFKLRLGWSATEENYLDLAKGLEQCGAGWLTLHPRYARQYFAGNADWSALARLRRAVSLPLMASGDLFDAASALRCLDESGVDGVMFARGAMHNPAIFSEYLTLVQNAAPFTLTSSNEASAGVEPESEFISEPGAEVASERISEAMRERAVALKRLMLRHAELARAMPEKNPHCRRRRGDKIRPDGALLKMRGAIPRYVCELPGSRAFRVEMSLCESWESFFETLEKFFQPFEY